MRYLFFSCEDEKCWIELDNESYATRQIAFSDGGYHVSCLEDCLAEGQIRAEELEADVVEISAKDFEQVWDEALVRYRKTWDCVKRKYQINDFITAKLMYYYPQGAIFQSGNILGKYIGNQDVKLHDELKMKIVGYDDANMWIVAR